MTTVHIEIDEALADAVRRKAAAEGKTLEGFTVDLLAQQVPVPANGRHWVERFLELADKAGGDSRGWKWNRDELYDE